MKPVECAGDLLIDAVGRLTEENANLLNNWNEGKIARIGANVENIRKILDELEKGAESVLQAYPDENVEDVPEAEDDVWDRVRGRRRHADRH